MKGYYKVGNSYHTSAVEAWSDIKSNPLLDYELILDDGRFDLYDWTIEESNIQHHEEERARQILNKGSYFRLLYSGGSDSFSVAHAFLRIGRPVDEYLMYEWGYMVETGFDSPTYTDQKIVWLKELHQSFGIPEPKITILKVNKDIIEDNFNNTWGLHGFGYMGTQGYSANHLADLCTYSNSDQKIINIMGMEKPRVFANDTDVWFEMNDKNTMYSITDKVPVEWFYLSADNCQLVNAQCRGAIRVAKGLFPDLSLKESLHKLQTETELYDLWCKSLGRKTSSWQNFMSKGCKNYGISSLHKTGKYNHIEQSANDNLSSWKNYNNQLNRLIEITGTNDPDGIITKRYILGKIQDV